MPLVIQVRVSNDGDPYCIPDPGKMKIKDKQGNVDKEIQWHYGQGEFSIRFDDELDSPFEDGTFEKTSEGGWIRTIVNDHANPAGYVYSVEILETSEQKPLKAADPGLIIKP